MQERESRSLPLARRSLARLLGGCLALAVVFAAAPQPAQAQSNALVVDTATLWVVEGESETFEVKLSQAPTGDVTVTVASADTAIATVSPASLTFTTGNWNTEQDVTVTGAQDSDSQDESVQVNLTASDGGYAGVTGSKDVSVADDEAAGLVVTPLSLDVLEESTTTFTVRLRSDPGSNNTALVNLSAIRNSSLQDTNKITLSDIDEVSFASTATSSAKLWSEPQTVTVAGAQDGDGRDEQARVWLWVTGYPGAGNVNVFVNVTVDDDEGRYPPGKPGNYTAEPGDGQATLSWTAPTSGGLVDKWQVRYKAGASFGSGDDSLWSDIAGSGASTTSHTVTGLTNGTAYVFEWRGVNGNGESGEASGLVQTTPLSLPAPTVTATAGDGEVALSWTDPQDSSISKWQVRYKAGTGDYGDWTDITGSTASTASHTVDSLTNDTEYGFEVRALKQASVTVDGTASTVTVSGAASAEVTATPVAPPPASLTVVPSSLTVAEGGSGTFTVALAAAPSADVTVSVAQDTATANADVTVSPASLTFTTSNYSTAQTVTVSAAQDDDDEDDSATLSLTASGGDYGSVTGTVSVTVDDDDEAPAQPTGLTAAQGNGQVALSWDDPQDASITKWQVRHKAGTSFADSDDLWTDIAGSGASTTGHTVTGLTNGTQYVFEVRAVNAVGAGTASDDATATPVADPGLTMTPASLSIDEGSSDTFTVVLDALPTGNVTVSLASDNTDVSMTPSPLTFTAANWATTQTVTVNTAADSNNLDDSAVVSLSASGGGYGSVSGSVTVAVLDTRPPRPANLTAYAGDSQVELRWDVLLAIDQWEVRYKADTGSWSTWAPESPTVVAGGRLSHTVGSLNNGTPYDFEVRGVRTGAQKRGLVAQVTETPVAPPAGLTIVPGSLTVAEGGSGTFTVALATAPTADVTVSVSQDTATANADVTVDTASLTFTTSNYSTAQTVTVSAAQDDDGDDDTATLSLSASGGDYASVTGTVSVTVDDDDEVPAPPTGFTATAGDGEVALSWNDPSNASITKWQVRYKAGTGDYGDWTDITGSTASTTSHTVTGLTNATAYVFQVRAVNAVGNGAESATATATPEPDPALTVSVAILSIDEGGSGTFTVALAAAPTADVTVSVSQDAATANTDVTVDTASLTFTTSNYSTAQTVTVSAAQDDDGDDDTATLSLSASGGDYVNVTGAVSVTVDDDDEAPAAPLGFTAAPGDEQVQLAWTNPQDSSITKWQVRYKEGSSLTDQDTATWSDIAGSGASTTGHTVTGLTNGTQYVFEVRAVNAVGAGTASDDATATPVADPGLTMTPASLSIDEGSSDTFTVVLDALPTGNVTVSLASDNTDVSMTPSPLTFTAANWATTQTVTVNTAADSNNLDDSAVVSLSASGGGYGSVSGSVTVAVLDTRPPRPANLTAYAGDSQVELRWDVLLAIDQWEVRYKADTGSWSTWAPESPTVVAGGRLSHTVGSLNNGTPYDFEVRGVRTGAQKRGLVAQVTETPVAPPAGLTIVPGSLTVAEGGSGTFTVALATAPTADVTVSVSQDTATANADVTVDTASLTFTTSNYSTAQTVTVSAAQDDDGDDDTATLSLSASGGDYASVTGTVSVTVDDDDEVPAPPTGFTATAGDGEVALSWNDPSNASITKWQVRYKAGTGDYGDWTDITGSTASTTSHTVTGLTNATAYVFQVRAVNAVGNGAESATATATPEPDPALTVSVAILSIDEGGSGTFTVALAAAPTADVTVSVSQDAATANTDVTVDTASLTFTTSNYSTAQTVTVSAAQDDDGDDDTATLSLSASGGDYVNVTGAVSVTVDDDDEAPAAPLGFTAAPGDEQVQLAWTNPQDSSITKWQVRYKEGSSLTDQDTATWSDIAGSGASTTGHTVTGLTNGTQYVFEVRAVNAVGAGTASDDATATPVADPGLTMTPASLSIDEGSSDTFTVVLDALPTGNVTVSLASDNTDVSMTPSPLTFTAANWATTQTVTVNTAADSNNLDDSAVVSLSASGGGYGSVSGSVTVAVLDTRPPRPANLTAYAGDSQVELRWDVLLAIDQWEVRYKADTGSWSTWAPESPTVVAGGRLSHTVGSLNNGTPYDFEVRGVRTGAQKRGLVAQVTETPVAPPAGLTIVPGSLTVAEGGSGTFTVALATAPTADVTVSVSQDTATANADVTVDTASLTFTTSNYSTAQTVTVSAAQDDDGDDDTATLSLSASGGDYASVTGTVSVTVDDDDEVPAPPTGFTATAGDGEVALSWNDPSNASITKWQVRYKAGTGDYGDWTDITGSTASTTSHTVTGLTNATAYVFQVRAVNAVGNGAESATATATPEPDPALTVSVSSLTIDEGSSGTFTVALATAPTADVTVNVSQNAATANTDVTVSPASLTFTTSNYATAQTVTVSAAQDDDGDDDSATLSLSASGGGYASVTGSVSVTVDDDDYPVITISPGPNVNVGDPATFTLTASPAVAVSSVNVTVSDTTNAAAPGEVADRIVNIGANGSLEQSVGTDAAGTVSMALLSGAGYTVGTPGFATVGVNSNTAPTVQNPVADQSVAVGAAVTVNLETSGSEVFADAESDTLTYTASSGDTSKATVSVDNDADTLAVTGVAAGTATITVTANDGRGGTVSDAFDVTVSASNNSPSFGTSTIPGQSYMQNTAITTVTLPAATGGDGTLTYTLSPAAPAGLTFDATARTLSGTPTTPQAATEYTYTVTDADGETDSLTFDITITIAAGLSLSTTSLPLTEGGSAGTFTVALAAPPPGTVTVAVGVSSNDTGAATVSPASLTFTAGNYNTTQTVTVTPVDDADAADETVTVNLDASGGGYDTVSASVTVTVDDDETAGLLLSTTSLSLTEGGNAGTFTVALAAPPPGTVTVAVGVSSNDTSAATVSPASLTFTAGNYNTTQTVTVTPVDDADAADETVTVNLDASGGGYDTVSASVTVTVDDDETAGLLLSTTSLPLTEGGNAGTFTVALAAPPPGTVTVAVGVSSNDTGAATVSPASLTFTAGNYNTTQTVTVTPVDDADAADETVTVNLDASGGGYDTVSASVTVTVDDDETAGLLLSTTSLPLTEGGNAGTFTVALAAPPPGTVTVAVGVSSNDTGAATVSPASLTFTAGNYNTTQTVTVTPVDDADAADETVTVNLDASGGGYDTVSASVTVTVDDDETAGLLLSTTSLSLTEGGNAGTFTVALAAPPPGTVTVAVGVSSNDTGAATVSPASLTFTAGNYNTTQTVTVTPVDDADAADETVTVNLDASGGGYDTVSASVTVTVDDDDTAGLLLSTTSLPLTEGGSAGTFTVALAAPPPGTVTVAVGVSSNDTGAATVSPASLTFTAGNYNTTQTVTVTPVDDADAADETVTVNLDASGGGYDTVSASVTVTVDDDETAGLLLSTTSLPLTEGGSAGTFTVALAAPPPGTVTVAVGVSSNDTGAATVSPASLTLTADNYNTTQTVTVTPVDDADAADETVTVNLDASGGGYDSVSASVTVTVDDDETAGLLLSTTSLPLTEGGNAGTFTVALAAPPPGTVTVAVGVSSNDTGAATVSPASLTFTAGNYNTTQTVTVTPVDDADAADETVTVNLDASGGGYDSVSASVTVTVDDDETAGLLLSTTSLPLTEGGSAGTFTVALAAPPPGTVTVAVGVSSNDTGAATVSPASLTFTADNYNTTQTVTVTPVDDADAADETVTVNLDASGGGYDSVSASVTVTVDDDETAEFVLSATNLSIGEDGSAQTYTVALTAPPPDGVTVTVDVLSGDTGAATVSPAQLTFTAQNYDTAQTVTVTPSSDADAADETVLVNLSASAGGYDGVGDSVSVAVDDDETAEFVLSATNLSIEEDSTGGTNTYTVALTAPPPEGVTVTVDVLSGDIGAATVSPAQLTFTAENYDTAQTVTVIPLSDADAADETLTVSLGAAGGGYDGVGDSVSVAVDDDEIAEFVLSATSLSLTEGGSGTFTVALTAEPLADVTVSVSKQTNSANADVTVDATSLTFTTNNYSTAQTVTVSAAQDADGDDDSATLSLSASGGGYDSVTGEVNVTVTDDDPKGLNLSATSVTLIEGGTGTFNVSLATKPSSDVSVTVTGASDVSVTNGGSLTFTENNYTTVQTVTLSAAEDDDGENDSVTVSLSSSGGGYGSVTSAVSVTVTDNDPKVLNLSRTSLSLTEGGSSRTFTVALATTPTGAVTVTAESDNTGVATVSPTSSFQLTASSTQIVTVTPVNDGSTTVSLSASGGGYDEVSASVSVSVVDPPNRAPVANPPIADVSVTAGSSVTVGFGSNFSDPDGDTLTYSVTSGDTAIATVSGLSNSDATVDVDGVAAGTTAVTVTATDGSLSASHTFNVTVTPPPNRAPVANPPIADVSVTAGSSVTVGFGSNFSDPDGDTLTYSVTSGDTAIATVSGLSNSNATVDVDGVAAGTTAVTVTATDGSLSASHTFNVTVTPPPNRAPVANPTIADVSVTAGSSVTVGFGSNFSDPDGDTLTYSVTSGDTAIATVSGLSNSDATMDVDGVAAGTTAVTVTATDGSLSASHTFNVTVTPPPNRAPVANPPIADVSVTAGSSVTVGFGSNFSDPDGDTLTYSVTSGDTAIATVSGLSNSDATVDVDGVAAGTTAVTVTATDGSLSASHTFNVTVTAPLPVVTIAAVADEVYVGDPAVFSLSATSAVSVTVSVTDVDGTTSQQTVGSNGSLSFSTTDEGTISVSIISGTGYTVGNPGSATVNVVDPPPGGLVVVQSGPNNGTLTISLATQPSAAVTVGLTVDATNVSSGIASVGPSSLTFSAGNWSAGQTSVAVCLDYNLPAAMTVTLTTSSTDTRYASLQQQLSVSCGLIDPFPSGSLAVVVGADGLLPGAGIPGLLTFAGQSVEALRLREGRAVREELPEAQGGEGALTYALSPALPAGLRFNADTRTISGTPLTPVAETRYTLTVTESEASAEAPPQSASLSFLLEVGADTKPVFAQAVADMAFERNRPIDPRVLPLATGGEGELRYALEPFLPAGLYLDEDTRTISGTPETVREETLYRWTAVDSDGDMAVAEFRMTVVSEPSVAGRAAWAHKAILPDLVRGATDMTLDAVGARTQQARTGDTQGLAAAGTGEAQLLGQRFAFGGSTDKNADPQSSALDSLPSLLQSTGPTLNTEDAGEALMQRMLEGASFRMHLGGGADGMGRRYTLWGQGGYRSLSAEQDGIAFSGGLSGLHLGADTRLSDTLLAGVAVSHSSAQMDYTETYRGETLEGVYGFTLSGVHPYADWQHASGLGVWLSAGASRGEVQVWDRALEEQDAVRNALSVHALSGGVERPLARRGVWGLAFKADGSVSDVTVSDVGSADDIALRVSRLRMSVQADWELGVWSPYAELGLRHDGGAGGSGMGLEAGGGVRYSGSSGWQFEGEARSLALGAGSRREWQLQATLSRQPAAGAGGFRMRLSPAYGPAGGMSGVLDRLWSDGMSGSVAPALGGLLDAGAYQSRLDLELGYGWPVNRGLVELYGGGSAMAGGAVNPAAASSGRLHVGGRFEATAGWHVRLELQWDGSAAGGAPSAPGGMHGDVFSSGLFGGASASGVSGLSDERLADVGPHTGEPGRYGDSLGALGTAPLNPAGRGIVLTISSRSLGR